MRIGIFCGSFDPPHLGHLILPCYAIKEFDLDKIIYVPSFKSVNKDRHFASCNDRLNMLKLLISRNPLLSIEDYEILKNTPSYTFETLTYLKEKYFLKKESCFLCIGSDWIDDLPNWKNFDIIKSLTNFIIFKRYPFLDDIEKKMERIKIDKNEFLILKKQIDISSSEIRNLIAEQSNFSYLLSESVYKYIIEKGLYR
ncbi:MAG TPA: nicotinate (nicotinamide) nucleotide adenylyltransferase [Exilispira sp.]|nr:nicotinate (nicotinamide) nucleotide adenylyltransferase [Exilispira sp.]